MEILVRQLALSRGHCEESSCLLLNVLAATFRAHDFLLVVLRQCEHFFERGMTIQTYIIVNGYGCLLRKTAVTEILILIGQMSRDFRFSFQ
jgi:hypothetical protein